MKRNRWLALVLALSLLLGMLPQAALAEELDGDIDQKTAPSEMEGAPSPQIPQMEEGAEILLPAQEGPVSQLEERGDTSASGPEEEMEKAAPDTDAGAQGIQTQGAEEPQEEPREEPEGRETEEASIPEDTYAPTGTITRFPDQGSVCTLTLDAEEKPALSQLLEGLPDSLAVEVDGEAAQIPVEWFCVGEDYESSDDYYFQFSPQWDESRWSLAPGLDLLVQAPYCAVFLTQGGLQPLSNSDVEVQCYRFLTETMGFNTAAACGVLANIYNESAFKPNNLQESYEKSLGFTDESYTAAVDNGTYKNFVKDSAGYGLVQLTYWTLKRDYLAYAQKKGVSIGDAQAQLEFLQIDLGATRTHKLLSIDNTANGAWQAGKLFCEEYERPGLKDQPVKRANLARDTFWPKYKDALARAESGVADALAAPALRSIDNAAEGVSLSWSGVAGASKYRIYRTEEGGAWAKLADCTDLSYTDTTALSAKTYGYTVRCLNSNGQVVSGFDENGLSITCWLAPVLTALNNTDKGIRLRWKNQGCPQYLVYRKVKGGKWDTPVLTAATSYTDTTPRAGGQYIYTVRCASAEGTPLSKHINSLPLLCLTPPQVKAANAQKGVQLTWNEVRGAGGYTVYRRSGSGKWKKLGVLKGRKSMAYLDKSVEKKNGSTFTYMVRAYRDSTLGGYNPEGVTVCRLVPPALSKVSGKKGTLTALWKKNPKAQGYQLRWVKGKEKGTLDLKDGAALKGSVKKLKKGTYYVSVRCWRKVGKKVCWSSWSGVKEVKVT